MATTLTMGLYPLQQQLPKFFNAHSVKINSETKLKKNILIIIGKRIHIQILAENSANLNFSFF